MVESANVEYVAEGLGTKDVDLSFHFRVDNPDLPPVEYDCKDSSVLDLELEPYREVIAFPTS